MSLPAHNLSAEELAEFREIFNLVDRDGGGTITKEELGEVVRVGFSEGVSLILPSCVCSPQAN